MSTVITPSMTDQIVLSTFCYLVDAELRKRMQGSLDFRFGCQEGFIAALIMLFGEGDEITAEQAFDKEESWIHLTERIVDEKLEAWATACHETNDTEAQVDYEAMQEGVKNAVNEFAMQDPDLLRNALKNS